MLTVREVLDILTERIKEASGYQRKAKWLRRTVHLHPKHNEWMEELNGVAYRYNVGSRAEYISALLTFHHQIRGQVKLESHLSHRPDAFPHVYDKVLDQLEEEFAETLVLVWAQKAA